jgi:hypothetical protein
MLVLPPHPTLPSGLPAFRDPDCLFDYRLVRALHWDASGANHKPARKKPCHLPPNGKRKLKSETTAVLTSVRRGAGHSRTPSLMSLAPRGEFLMCSCASSYCSSAHPSFITCGKGIRMGSHRCSASAYPLPVRRLMRMHRLPATTTTRRPPKTGTTLLPRFNPVGKSSVSSPITVD